MPDGHRHTQDPYRLDAAHVVEPPRALAAILRRIGPGLVLSASIVGSGELIATTTLGARAGYSMMWLIIVSCLIKAVVQALLGRHVIATGDTTLIAFSQVPGPRARVNWVVWAWAGSAVLAQFVIAAMYIGIAQVMYELVPQLPRTAWIGALGLLTLALLLGGGYMRIERIATAKVAVFTSITCLSAIMMMQLPQFFSWRDIGGGLVPTLPSDQLSIALAVFGTTGVAAGELCAYPYWCIEKGYARFTGPRDDTPAWRERARGWIRVMHVDVVVSLAVYTLATVAFYLLGAGILHRTGQIPAGNKMIAALSNIYTQTLGPWAVSVFYCGAIVILYGTIFALTASNARVFADFVQLLGGFTRDDHARRVRTRDIFIVAITATAVGIVLAFGHAPLTFVTIAGVAQAALLVVVTLATLYLALKRTPFQLKPSRLLLGLSWFACLSISAFVLPSLYFEITRLFR